MNHTTGILLRPQKINIFSKRKTERVQMRWSYFFVLLVCAFVGLFAVWERIQYVRTAYSIQQLRQENDKLLQDKRKLLLEYNTSISLDIVEERARKKLSMGVPEEGQTLYVK